MNPAAVSISALYATISFRAPQQAPEMDDVLRKKVRTVFLGKRLRCIEGKPSTAATSEGAVKVRVGRLTLSRC